MPTRFFTSDLHIGDKAIAHWRRFSSVAEHDVAMLAGINRRVESGDELWILGDMWGSTPTATLL